MDDEGDPIGYLLLRKGTPVVTRDGIEVGRVAKVQDNEREHIFDGIVVRTDRGKVFVDAPEVARIAERRVTLTIDAGEVADLPEHKGWVGAVEHAAQRRMHRLKRRF